LSAVWWALWLQLCLIIAMFDFMRIMFAKTHAKAVQTANRANLIAPVAKAANQAQTTATTVQTSVQPIVTAGNATFLATLALQGTPSKATGYPYSGWGGPNSNSNADLYTWANAAASDGNEMITYMGDLASWLNDLYDTVQNFGAF
jgi:hypothetical protein